MSKPLYYYLDGKIPKPTDDIKLFGESMNRENGSGIVARTELPNDILISTVFLGIDHSFSFEKTEPILFETMIFGGEEDGYQDRYSTWEEAEIGHQKAVKIAETKTN